MTPVIPVLKTIYLCDEVVQDPTSRKIHLLGVFNAVRVSPTTSFPFNLGRICVLAQLVDGLGEVSFHIEVVQPDTGQRIYSSAKQRLHFPDRRTTIYACHRVLNFSFPGPGVYVVELYLQDTFCDDCLLSLLLEEGA